VLRSFIASVVTPLVLTLALWSGAAHADEPSAMETFKRSHDAVLALVRKGADNVKIQKEVDAFLDYTWIAEQSLGGTGRYDKRCEPRCAEFEELLERLIRENYLRRIRQSDKGAIEILGEEFRRGGKKAKVDTVVTVDKDGTKQRIEVSYVMHKTDDGWVCRNIITDGVSLAKNYRFEFNKVLREEGIDGLIARLETKLTQVAKAD
jgi:phospholipid transport system substrate-binding protein